MLLFAFWGVTLVLIVVPGPDWAFILTCGARDRVVLPAVAGLMAGYALLTVLVAAGIGALVAHSWILLTALTAMGASYLIYLGTTMLREHAEIVHPDSSTNGGLRAGPTSNGTKLVRGIGVSGLNPKGLLIFLAILPQFTDPRGAWPVPLQLAALGCVFVVTCGVFYTAMGIGARSMLASRAAASRLIARVSGLAMISVGLVLLVERLVAASSRG
jgi:threonine/homoserine/homoserine lactone efflux protein